MELQFAEMLTSKIYMDYIKDLFNKKRTMKYLKETSPQNKVPGCKSTIQRSLPPYGISYKNLTYEVGTLENKCVILMLDTSIRALLGARAYP